MTLEKGNPWIWGDDIVWPAGKPAAARDGAGEALRTSLNTSVGGKGIVSKILPDDQMPTTVGGNMAEVAFSCLGIINRLNPSVLYEHELNAAAAKIARHVAPMETEDAIAGILGFLGRINPQQEASFRVMFDSMDDGEKDSAVAEMIEEGIPIHQPPFHGNVTLVQLGDLYKHYGPLLEPDKFVGIERPMILGKVYYLALKHHPMGKFSARSARYISIKEVPSKNNREYKAGQAVYSTTPVRMGYSLAPGDRKVA